MASLESLKTRYFAAKGIAQRVSDDTPILIRMRYVGTVSATSVTVTTGTNLVTVSQELVSGVSTITTKTYTFATYTTLGSLVAAINADGLFEAHVLDALLSDITNTGNYQVNGAITAGTDSNGVVCYDVLGVTNLGPASQIGYTVTLSKNRNFNAIRHNQGHRFHIVGINYYSDVGTAASNKVRIYQRKNGVETQIWGAASIDTTDTAILFANGNGKITGDETADLIVRVTDAAAVTHNALAYLQVTGISE